MCNTWSLVLLMPEKEYEKEEENYRKPLPTTTNGS